MWNSALYPDGFRSELERCWQLDCGGEPGIARRHAEVVCDAAAAAGDAEGLAFASQQLAWFCFQLGDIEQGLSHVLLARQIWRQRDSARGQAWAGAMHAWL